MINDLVLHKLNNVIMIAENNQKLLASIIVLLATDDISPLTDEQKIKILNGATKILEGTK